MDMVSKIWTKEEEKLFTEIYPHTKSEEIASLFNVSVGLVYNKAHRMGLVKSKAHISKMIANRNVLVGRDWSLDIIKKISIKYKSKSEFQKKNSAAYSAAKKNGWLEECCSHMVSKSFSIPQLIMNDIVSQLLNVETYYNDRKMIKPKELDVWIPKYNLAFEYDGKGWHIETNNKKFLCAEKNITLITLIENNRNYERDIKNQLINMLKTINEVTGLFINKMDVENVVVSKNAFDKILDVNQIKKICNKYDSLSKFKREKSNLYDKIIKVGKLDELTGHMSRKRIRWNVDKIQEVVKKYTTLTDFIENQYGCYLYIMRNKHLLYLLDKLKRSSG